MTCWKIWQKSVLTSEFLIGFVSRRWYEVLTSEFPMGFFAKIVIWSSDYPAGTQRSSNVHNVHITLFGRYKTKVVCQLSSEFFIGFVLQRSHKVLTSEFLIISRKTVQYNLHDSNLYISNVSVTRAFFDIPSTKKDFFFFILVAVFLCAAFVTWYCKTVENEWTRHCNIFFHAPQCKEDIALFVFSYTFDCC